MRKDVLLYGLVGAALIAVLQAIEFRWIIIEHSIAIQGGLGELCRVRRVPHGVAH